MPSPVRRDAKLGILVGALLLIAGCSAGDGDGGPGDTVESFFMALNDGDYGAAKGMYNADAAAAVNNPELTPEGAYRDWAQIMTKKGSIEEVKILDSDETETGVNVRYELVYGDGTTRPGEVELTQESGAYRLGLVR